MISPKLNALRYDIDSDGDMIITTNGDWVDAVDYEDLRDAYKELKADADRMAKELIAIKANPPSH
jgi:hypothetical protein